MNSPAFYLNGQLVPRGVFYEVACDSSRSVVVEACAGAGKTWMLVSRVLRALLDGAEPQQILAITFTRKAAGEMRHRLNAWLEEFSAACCDQDRRVAELQMRGMSADQARQAAPRLAGLHAKLLAAGRPVQILTFHRWFLQLLRVAPLELLGELGLSPDIELVEEWADHDPEIYRRFHQAVMSDPALQADFDELVYRHGRSQLRKWLAVAMEKRVEFSLADSAGRLEVSVPPAVLQWPQFQGLSHPVERLQAGVVHESLLTLARELAAKSGVLPAKHAAQIIQALELTDLHARLEKLRSALYTDKGGVRKAVDADGLALALAHLEEIQAACEQQLACEEHLCMVRLSRCLLRERMLYKREHALADMADLELCALRLMSDAHLSGWVQERLDSQIRQLLIDEFQDTSPLQWHALHAWLSAYAGAGGGASGQRPPSVFIVGDPKQSIYRFRRAEPKVFEAAQRFVQEALGGAMLSCDHTHRNAPGVLSVVNAVLEDAQQQGEFDGFRRHTTERSMATTDAVWRLPLPPEDPAARGPAAEADHWRDSLTTPRTEPEVSRRQFEARQVAQAIAQLVRAEGVPPHAIKVLARRRSVLAAVQLELQSLSLPFAAVGSYRLAEHIVVKDLLALLDVLASSQHRLSLAHALRSPIFSASDDDLISLAAAARASPEPQDWWSALTQVKHASDALQRAAALLPQWRTASQQLPPHDLLDRIVFEGQLRERVLAVFPASAGQQALAAIDALLEQTLTVDGARYVTPYRFVRALRRRVVDVALPAPSDAVELLTVHGAKGLESPWVFLMDTDPPAQAAETVTMLIDWPVQERAPVSCGFVYGTRRCPPSLQPLLERELHARDREELNGLYVAMTRAKSCLVFSATAGASKKAGQGPRRRSWWQRLQPLGAPWEHRPINGVISTGQEALPPAKLWELPTWSYHYKPDIQNARSVLEDLQAHQPRAGALGEAIHLCLQWASAEMDSIRSTPADTRLPDLESMAQAAAVQHAVGVQEVLRGAQAIWTSPQAEPFFRGDALRWAGNEVPIVVEGRTLRMDRLVALEENGQTVWWVLDYKLHHRPHEVPQYRAQLAAYQSAVQALAPSDTVRCALISGEGVVVEISTQH